MIVKKLLHKSKSLRYFAALLYSLPVILVNINPILKGQVKVWGVFMRNVRFRCNGKNIRIYIGPGTVMRKCKFYCKGDNTSVEIEGESTRINNTSLYCADSNSRIIISKSFSMEGGHIAATEGKSIRIGVDCMFSNDIEIRNGDSHSIWLLHEDRRINPAKNVIIGNHVWLCAHCRIMKGSVIPDNSIIGNSALVSGILTKCNSIYTGSPARLVKNDIEWSRHRFKR